MRQLAIAPVMALGCVLLTASLFSQTSPSTRPTFDVASIKPSAPGSTRRFITSTQAGQFIATNYPLKGLVGYAYMVRNYQLSGGTPWMETDGWEIQSNAEPGSVPPRGTKVDLTVPSPMQLMLQSLLEERFQLKIHRETKELPVYELVVAKGGAKIKFSADQGPIVFNESEAPQFGPLPGGGLPPLPRGAYSISGGPAGRKIEGFAVELKVVVNTLISELNRPVIDKTDLKGLYDFKAQWIPDSLNAATGGAAADTPAASGGVSIFTALQEQLGLRLQSSKGPVEIIVIDGAQKPTPN